MAAIDLARIPGKPISDETKKTKVFWDKETEKLLIDAVFEELMDPERDLTLTPLEILRVKMKQRLPHNLQRDNLPGYHGVSFLLPGLKRKIRAEAAEREAVSARINALQSDRGFTVEQRATIIDEYLTGVPTENLIAIVAKKEAEQRKALEGQLLDYQKEILTQLRLHNSEVIKATQKRYYQGPGGNGNGH
jgi:hypothetical protein